MSTSFVTKPKHHAWSIDSEQRVTRVMNGRVGSLNNHALIEDYVIGLPDTSTCYFQDKNGVWYHQDRRPRKGEGGNDSKEPIVCIDENNFKRPLITKPDSKNFLCFDTTNLAKNRLVS